MKSFCILSVLLFLAAPFSAFATDWVFRGQPKDGGEQYIEQPQDAANRTQRKKLLSDCDALVSRLNIITQHQSQKKPIDASNVPALSSCGLIFGVDHREEKSIACLKSALDLATSTGNTLEQANILNYLGIVHALWGKFSQALDYHGQCLQLCSTIPGGSKLESSAYSQIGLIMMFYGDYRKAFQSLNKGLILQESDPSQSWLILDNLGLLSEACGRYDQALMYFRQSIEIKRRLNLYGAQVASLSMMGRVQDRLGNTGEALQSLNEAVSICREKALPADYVIDQIGNLLLDHGEIQKSEEFVKRAGFWQSLGRLYVTKGDYGNAEIVYNKLLNYSEARNIPDYLCVAHTGLGIVNEEMGNVQKAADHFRKAIGLTELIRQTLSDSERVEFFDARSGGFYRTAPYKGLARVLVKMNKPAEALKESEYTKSRYFSEMLSRNAGGSAFNLPQEVIDEDFEINREIAAVNRALQKAHTESQQNTKSLESKSNLLTKRLANHIEKLRKDHPQFAAVKYPLPMSLDQADIKDDEFIISYDVTESALIIYLSHGKKLVKTVLNPTSKSELETLIRKFRDSFEVHSTGSLKTKLEEFNGTAGHKLFKLLLEPVLSDLPKGDSVKIVPDGLLGVLPFEALITSSDFEIDKTGDFPKITADFFTDRNPVTYIHSITALSIPRYLERGKSSSDKLLAIVDPVFSVKDSRLTHFSAAQLTAGRESLQFLSFLNDKGLKLERLPLTGKLGRKLKESSPQKTDLFEGIHASKKALRENRLAAYDSILFATHGCYDGTIPDIKEPVLFLSPTLDQNPDDGLLRLTEVMNLKINAKIVALTACETGLGRNISGEGIMGMGRAFQYAGAESVITSLWSVAEEPSVALIENFFGNLRAGQSQSQALRTARHTIRKSGYDHPFFWAGFILVGDVSR